MLAALAVRISPAERRNWAEALRAELPYVPAGAAMSFALGGVVTALRLRVAHPPFVLGTARYGLAVGALVWAALHMRMWLHLNSVDPSLPAALSLATGIVFAIGGLITALRGLRPTVWLALPMLVLLGLYTGAAGVLMPQSPNRAFYQALALEDAVALLSAITVAALARCYAATRRTPPR